MTSLRTALLGIVIIGALFGIVYLVAVLQLPMGTLAKPGSGFFLVFIVGLWFVSCLGIGLEALPMKEAAKQIDWPRGVEAWRLLQVIGGGVVYVVMLIVAGYVIAAVVISLIALRAMGGFRWYVNVGIAVAMGLGSYLLFDTLLKVPLPRGIWLS